jgi:hypothetical protein
LEGNHLCDDRNAPLRDSVELDHAPLSIETKPSCGNTKPSWGKAKPLGVNLNLNWCKVMGEKEKGNDK